MYLLLNKLRFRPHSGPLFTRAIALAQNQLSKRTSLVQTCCISHIMQLQFAVSRRRSIISSSVLKSDVSKRNGSRFSVLVIQKPLQVVLDSRTRTALAVGMFVRDTCCSARIHYQFSLHSSSLSVLFE